MHEIEYVLGGKSFICLNRTPSHVKSWKRTSNETRTFRKHWDRLRFLFILDPREEDLRCWKIPFVYPCGSETVIYLIFQHYPTFVVPDPPTSSSGKQVSRTWNLEVLCVVVTELSEESPNGNLDRRCFTDVTHTLVHLLIHCPPSKGKGNRNEKSKTPKKNSSTRTN